MNDFNRNTRTLIVSFLIAIFALIPLRFVEVGQQGYLGQSQVLGDSAMEKVVDCINQEELGKIENQIYTDYMDGKISEDEVESLLVEIGNKESNICQ